MEQKADHKEREVNLRDYLEIIIKRKTIIILSIAVVTISSMVFARHSPPLYKATVFVSIERLELGNQKAALDSSLVQKYLEGFIKSYGLAEEALRSLMMNKAEDLKKKGELADESFFDMTPAELQNSIVVEQSEGSGTVGISVLASNPKKAMYLANAVAKVFVDLSLKGLGGGAQSDLKYVKKQIGVFKDKIEKDRRALARYGEDTEVATGILPEKEGKLDKMQKEYAEVRLNRQMAEARLKILQKRISKTFFPAMGQTKELLALNDKLSDLERKRSALLVQFTEEHPSVIAVQMEIDKIKLDIEEETKKPLTQLQAEIEGLKTKEDTLKEVIETNFRTTPQADEKSSVKGAIDKSGDPDTDSHVFDLKFELAMDKKIYALLMSKVEQLRIEALLEVNKIKILRLATEPKNPEKSKGPPLFLVALLLGLILGITVAFVLENMDTSLTTIEDVEYYLNQPVIGVIPMIRPEAARRKERGM